jgi:hypothetical protein
MGFQCRKCQESGGKGLKSHPEIVDNTGGRKPAKMADFSAFLGKSMSLYVPLRKGTHPCLESRVKRRLAIRYLGSYIRC